MYTLITVLLFIVCTAFIPRNVPTGGESVIKNQIENAVDPNQVPSFPAAGVPTTPTDTTK